MPLSRPYSKTCASWPERSFQMCYPVMCDDDVGAGERQKGKISQINNFELIQTK